MVSVSIELFPKVVFGIFDSFLRHGDGEYFKAIAYFIGSTTVLFPKDGTTTRTFTSRTLEVVVIPATKAQN